MLQRWARRHAMLYYRQCPPKLKPKLLLKKRLARSEPWATAGRSKPARFMKTVKPGQTDFTGSAKMWKKIWSQSRHEACQDTINRRLVFSHPQASWVLSKLEKMWKCVKSNVSVLRNPFVFSASWTSTQFPALGWWALGTWAGSTALHPHMQTINWARKIDFQSTHTIHLPKLGISGKKKIMEHKHLLPKVRTHIHSTSVGFV